MNFLHNDLGYLGGSETVEVTLDKAANVTLMDTANFNRYRTGGRHQYYGGEVTRSPLRVAVPRSGHWHLAVDLGGFAGTIRAGNRVVG
ncbi:DUF1883 domain-containing protein [Rhizobium laguerreae]|uniref:DUF1883 domain-containing protein n=1 Tax=Rhizobium laguerreae TaxID=1076926 RepID=UPI001E2D152F|nr:DUF1883 domain-containing protein [Rhizobium laguerreae]UFW64452.1 DUF1883 domain-containing protein [Rhizobium laguerreae]